MRVVMRDARRRAATFGAGALALGGLFAAPAQAAIPLCAGTQNTIVVCVETDGGTLYEDCIYLASSTCTPVSITGPAVSCGGDIGTRLCAVNYDPPIN
jgi:hypothetical protein